MSLYAVATATVCSDTQIAFKKYIYIIFFLTLRHDSPNIASTKS